MQKRKVAVLLGAIMTMFVMGGCGRLIRTVFDPMEYGEPIDTQAARSVVERMEMTESGEHVEIASAESDENIKIMIGATSAWAVALPEETFAQVHFAQAVSLDGTEEMDFGVNMPDTEGYTVSLWMKPESAEWVMITVVFTGEAWEDTTGEVQRGIQYFVDNKKVYDAQDGFEATMCADYMSEIAWVRDWSEAGADGKFGISASGEMFKGEINDLYIYETALEEGQVTALYLLRESEAE